MFCHASILARSAARREGCEGQVTKCGLRSYTRSYIRHHERPLPGLHRPPRSAGSSPSCSASRSPRGSSGTPRARRWSTAPSRSAVAAGWPSRWSGSSTSLGIAAVERDRPRGATYKGLVFDATGLTSSDQLVALRDFFTPAAAQPRPLPARGRARHAAGAGRRRRAGRPARARGLHPQPRQGDRPRRHRPARVRRRGRRGLGRQHAGVPALPQVGVRVRPGRPDRRARRREARRRSPTGPARSTARSRWSPARAAASASRSPGCCTATARPSSASTYPRPPASSRA